ncbi:MAG TPA: hypothetical protein VGX78_00240 [Pirellulales bacterium]|jgi:hypothetical protein|nr:hypothetical protein [Pirellulales bacterium]
MWYAVKPLRFVCWLPALVACASLASSVRADESKTLRWKFVKGETSHYVLEQDVVQEATSDEQSSKTTVKQTFDVTWKVNSVDDQGVAELTRTVERVRINAEGPPEAGPPVAFDSSKKGMDPRMVESFKPLLKQPFVMKIDPQGVISDVKVPDSTKEALKGPPAPNGASTEDAFKEMLAADTVEFPAKGLTRGSHWQHTSETQMPFGKQKVTTTYTYAGPAKHEGHELDKIDMKVHMELLDADRGAKGRPEPKPKIVSQESGGVIYFDGEKGRLVSSQMKNTVETEVTQGDKKFTETVNSTMLVKLVSDDHHAAENVDAAE